MKCPERKHRRDQGVWRLNTEQSHEKWKSTSLWYFRRKKSEELNLYRLLCYEPGLRAAPDAGECTFKEYACSVLAGMRMHLMCKQRTCRMGSPADEPAIKARSYKKGSVCIDETDAKSGSHLLGKASFGYWDAWTSLKRNQKIAGKISIEIVTLINNTIRADYWLECWSFK